MENIVTAGERAKSRTRINSVVAAGNETKACVGSHYFYVGNMFDRARQARFQVEDLREVAVVTLGCGVVDFCPQLPPQSWKSM